MVAEADRTIRVMDGDACVGVVDREARDPKALVEAE